MNLRNACGGIVQVPIARCPGPPARKAELLNGANCQLWPLPLLIRLHMEPFAAPRTGSVKA